MTSSKSVMETKEKLMKAAINLIAEKGYNGVTTLEIAAAAGLSEKTLFRHFGSKQNLLETAVEHYHYAKEMRTLFKDQLVWNLEKDLLLISRTYHEIMYRNRKLIQISVKEGNNLPGFREKAHQHPEQLKKLLTNYFTEMKKRGKIIDINPEQTAISFMLMHFGISMNYLHAVDTTIFDSSLDEIIKNSVQLFIRALTP